MEPFRLPKARIRCYTGAMRRRRRAVGLAVVACVLTGCPTAAEPGGGADSSSRDQPLPGQPDATDAPLPTYAGPPAGGPPSVGPLTSLRGSVDLTPAIPGYFSHAETAVGGPDGGAYVVVSPEQPGPASQQLVTVGPADGGFAIIRSVPIPPLDHVVGLHLLADGTLAIAGRLQPAHDPRGGYGFAVVDPVTGAARTTTVVPYGKGAASAFGRSALGPDGRTLYLFVSVTTSTFTRERLLAVDATTDAVLAEHDLAADVATVSQAPMRHEAAGLVARPGGGVTLVFDALPNRARPERIPTLLTFDARLEPVGGPVAVTTLAEAAETQAVAAGSDGTVFLVVEVTAGAWILAVPDAGGAGPVLVQLDDHLYDYSMTVEPAQLWALLPAFEGVRAVDLTTGEIRGPLDVGCPGQDIRAIYPGTDGAVLIGECNSPRTRTQVLWLVGPGIGP